MTITAIKIRKITNDEKMKAIVSITIDNCLALHDIKVIMGKERLFVAMPSRKTPEGRYVDIVHPISKELRAVFENEIIAAYEKALDSLTRGDDLTASEQSKLPGAR